MLKKLSLIGATAAIAVATVAPTAAEAQSRYRDGYNRQGYSQPYYGRSGRHYNNRAGDKCRDGDGGTIVGAIAGGLLGNTVAGRGDRLLGTVLGGAVGAVAGREIDRSDRPNYCRRR